MIPSNFRIEILLIRALLCAMGSKGLDKFANFHFLSPSIVPEFIFL